MKILILGALIGIVNYAVAGDAETLQQALFQAKGLYSCQMTETATGVTRSWRRGWLALSSDTDVSNYAAQFSMEAPDYSIDATYEFGIDWPRGATLAITEGGLGTDHMIRMNYTSPRQEKALTLELRPSGAIKNTITARTPDLSVRCISW